MLCTKFMFLIASLSVLRCFVFKFYAMNLPRRRYVYDLTYEMVKTALCPEELVHDLKAVNRMSTVAI